MDVAVVSLETPSIFLLSLLEYPGLSEDLQFPTPQETYHIRQAIVGDLPESMHLPIGALLYTYTLFLPYVCQEC